MEWYIKLHRKILEWEWYDDPNTMRLFLHILLKANYSDKNWRGHPIKRWQLLTSLATLSSETQLSVKQVRSSIERLKRTNEMASYTTHQYTILEVVKYEDYQSEMASEETNDGQAEGKARASEGQQHKKDNKDKNNKKEKNIYRAFLHLSISIEENEKLKTEYSQNQIDEILDQIENYKPNKKYSSLYLTAKSWLERWKPDTPQQDRDNFKF